MSDILSIDISREIPFYDVDSYRIVWHGHYPKYFEEARCALLTKLGCSYADMEEWGYFFPIIELNTRYIKPLMFQQKISIRATLTEWRNQLSIDYVITDLKTKERLTKANTSQVSILMPDKITQFESPEILRNKIEALLKR